MRSLTSLIRGEILDESARSGGAARQSWDEFWGAYLDAHRSPLNRWLHVTGTVLSVGIILVAVVTRQWWWLVLAPVAGYGPAWIGHAVVEHNRPLTASDPVRSLICDYRMTLLMLSGRSARLRAMTPPSLPPEPT